MTSSDRNISIAHAEADREFANKIAEDLRARHLQVGLDSWEVEPGDNLIERVHHGLMRADHVLVVLSEAFANSAHMQRGISIMGMRELSQPTPFLLPLLLEDCHVPGFLVDRQYVDFRDAYEDGFEDLILRLGLVRAIRSESYSAKRAPADTHRTSTEVQQKQLRDSFQLGQLSLFCGAGVSVDAGIPAWNALLRRLVGDLFRKGVIQASAASASNDDLAGFYQQYFNPSALMIAQYLKNGLGRDYLDHVRNALYASNPNSCRILDTIVEICRPQRSSRSLRSIITYNFDDLIEQSLDRNSILFKSIYKEGQRSSTRELPVYHVHGFLPQSGELTPEHEIVFSEDAYHSQFMDPFSWSNLIQLNHLSSNTCLFIGLSVTDPNIRRLLDVSRRKAPDSHLNHYVFRHRHDRDSIGREMREQGIDDHDGEQADAFARGVELLEEQDFNNMGLNVIWVDHHDDIPEFLEALLIE